MSEVWRKIPGHYGIQASSSGRLRSFLVRNGARDKNGLPKLLKEPYILYQSRDSDEYRKVYISSRCIIGRLGRHKLTNFKVHRMVLLAFRGYPEPGQLTRHKNGNRKDNRISNLKWGTPIQNSRDMIRHQTKMFGENHPRAKLSLARATAIIRSMEHGDRPVTVARRFGITKELAYAMYYGRIWKCIKRRAKWRVKKYKSRQ